MSDKIKCEDCAHFDDDHLDGFYGRCAIVDATTARGNKHTCVNYKEIETKSVLYIRCDDCARCFNGGCMLANGSYNKELRVCEMFWEKGDLIEREEKKCSSCKWFDAPGLCRRYAPRGGEWGATGESNWCGDYEAGGGDEG